ncbi:hypothetical protein [Streptomyces anulatus]|uniref:hypothetical protein n=1 Tax=Streptomyces anulatus TaxID=1892 RepID=UPI002E0D6F0B|nr:hypothetical protein OG557_39155 [Streptomyces anulatus]
MSPQATTTGRATQAVSYDLDMDEVAAELYAALLHIETLNPGAADYPTPNTARDGRNGNANANPNTNFAPHDPIPAPNPR